MVYFMRMRGTAGTAQIASPPSPIVKSVNQADRHEQLQ
jgi:hypothetical protein